MNEAIREATDHYSEGEVTAKEYLSALIMAMVKKHAEMPDELSSDDVDIDELCTALCHL